MAVDDARDEAGALFETYAAHATALRTWFVAYGIGGPVFALSNEGIRDALHASGQSRLVGGAFLAGVTLQVLLAAVNKAAVWVAYYGECNPGYKGNRRYRFGSWLAEQFWIDLAIDFVTMVLFGIGTWQLFLVATAP